MIGIEYLCDINNMTYADLARELGISRQTIAAWISGRRNVSEKHYDKLKSIFKVPEEYFQKELTELDKLQLQRIKLENDAVTFTYIDKDYDGTEYENTFTDIDVDLAVKLDYEIHKEKTLKNIDNLISLKLKIQSDDQLEIDRAYQEAEKIMNLFDNLYRLISKDIYSIDRLKDLLDSIDVAKGKRLESRYFIRKLSNVIKEQMIKDQIKEEEQRKQNGKIRKLKDDPEQKEIDDLL